MGLTPSSAVGAAICTILHYQGSSNIRADFTLSLSLAIPLEIYAWGTTGAPHTDTGWKLHWFTTSLGCPAWAGASPAQEAYVQYDLYEFRIVSQY